MQRLIPYTASDRGGRNRAHLQYEQYRLSRRIADIKSDIASVTHELSLLRACEVHLICGNLTQIADEIFVQLPPDLQTVMQKVRRPLLRLNEMQKLEAIRAAVGAAHRTFDALEYKCASTRAARDALHMQWVTLEWENNALTLPDLPMEVIAHICRYLPARYRGVAPAFWQFVPIKCAAVGDLTVSSILRHVLTRTFVHADLPIRVRMHQIDGACVGAAQAIVGRRPLHLVVSTIRDRDELPLRPLHFARSAETTLQLSPVRVKYIYIHTMFRFVDHSRVQYLHLQNIWLLRRIIPQFGPDSPLREIEIDSTELESSEPQPPILLAALGPIVVRAAAYKYLVYCNVYFAGPVIIPDMKPSAYRKLRKVAINGDYLLSHRRLVGRDMPILHLPSAEYARPWTTNVLQ